MIREHVVRIRRALGKVGARSLVSVQGGYRLGRDFGTVDAHLFEASLRQGRESQRAGRYSEAELFFLDGLALWRDVQALTDVREVGVLEAEAMSLEESLLQCEQALIECHLHSGEVHKAIVRLHKLVTNRPHVERNWLLLMAAQCALGRRPEASDTYRLARRITIEEFGMNNSVALDSLHTQILRGESAAEVIASACLSAK